MNERKNWLRSEEGQTLVQTNKRRSYKNTILEMSIYPSIKYHIWSKSELNLVNYMSFLIFIEFVSDLDQSGTCSFIRLEMTAEWS